MEEVKVLDRIKKCLALSQSSEPHEAAAALRQAQKMMEKYGYTAEDVGRAEIGSAEFRSKFSVSKPKDYETRLVQIVANAFGCKILWRKSNSRYADVYGVFVLVGLKSQVPLAHYTIEVLQRKMVKARAEFVASLGATTRQRKVMEADGFCQGWANEISKTVHAFVVSDELSKHVVNKVSELSNNSKNKANVQNRKSGMHGYMAGLDAAKGESIHRPMGETKHKFLN